MAKPLSSFPAEKRKEVALRRVKGNTLGLGYLSAVDALAKMGVRQPGKGKKIQQEAELDNVAEES